MSWLKKLYSKLMAEDLHDVERPEQQRNKSSSQPEMDTKMTYKYPKGNFRFPLIPDPPESKQHVKEREELRNHRVNTNRVHRTDKETGQSMKARNKHNVYQENDYATKKIEPKSSQPFRPSNIPSPVYGFNRPKKEELMYELKDSFLAEEQLEKEKEPQWVEPLVEEETEEEEVVYELPQVKITKEVLPTIEVAVAETNDNLHTETEKVKEEVSNVNVDVRLEVIGDEQIEEAVETTIEEEKPKGRPPLPFNVLMLKKDREKLQKRKPVKEVQHVNNDSHIKQHSVTHQEIAATAQEVEDTNLHLNTYKFPSLHLLRPPVVKAENKQWLLEQTELLNETLENFNVHAHVVNVSQGPAVTRFEVQPERGVKVNKITNLSDDIKLSMAAKDIRMEAPIPGKRSIGIEIPNAESRPVQISEIIANNAFNQSESPLTAVLGLDISGDAIVTDLRRMPHGLIAGATGSGKSVCINSILVSLLYKATPDELKLLLIDPKMVELAPYNNIPHLVSPVITDVKAATAALKWTVDEMERRYELFAHASVRDIGRFNELAMQHKQYSDKLPYIVVVIDELADLMMMAPAEVEESICRIAQKARACGIHLLIATQRPSVDVITGLIKANVPTRIAFSVSSQVDSRTIIDISGAEKLLGRGDMLFLGSGSSKPVRIQGTFVSDEEIDRVIQFVRTQGKPQYLFAQEELLKKAQIQEEEDELFFECCEFVVNQGNASTSLLQRHFRVGYNRAARLIEMMEQQGIVSGANGSKPRDVLVNARDLEELKRSRL